MGDIMGKVIRMKVRNFDVPSTLAALAIVLTITCVNLLIGRKNVHY